MRPRRRTPSLRGGFALFILCSAIYLCTAPGRLLFPDDEIVFQTTEGLAKRGSLAIAGIDKRTGEPKDRPSGSFGWATGADGRRYGIFGHGLSVVALPLYQVGAWVASAVPPTWRHALRSDHYVYHQRSQQADWTRAIVGLTNCFVTAGAVVVLAAWLGTLHYAPPVAVTVALAYGLGTLAWPYAGTLLSEPLSALVLLLSAWAIACHHRSWKRHRDPRRVGWLWFAGTTAGLSVHVHVLNLVAVPCLVGYGCGPMVRDGTWAMQRRAWVGAFLLGATAIAALGVDQWLRFGDPWQTGRYDHYAHFVWPWHGIAAFLVAPGRSFFLYSPAILVGLVGMRALWRRHPDLAWFAMAIVFTRLLFAASRSDWWGGWGIGPRYLVAVVPFAIVPLAAVLADRVASNDPSAHLPDRAGSLERTPRRRWLILGLLLLACVLLEFHLASHSIFEWMFVLARQGTIEGVDYFTRSHWWPSASPVVGFATLPRMDMLSLQSVLLARRGHAGLAVVFGIIAAVGVVAAIVLARTLARERAPSHAPRHGPTP